MDTQQSSSEQGAVERSAPLFPFDNSYARLPEGFRAEVAPSPAPEPRWIAFNDGLAAELGLEGAALAGEAGLALFAGNAVPEGAEPVALAYAGHQFGNWVPQLGDGRAILLGEVVDRHGVRRDIQLKGAGRTPFSRGGDGRSPIGPVVREYLAGEAMAALGVSTTRALAAVSTGEPVRRGWSDQPGGVLTRVARSHVRVGTFEYFGRRGDIDAVRTLADYVIDRHYPHLAEAAEPYPALLEAIIEANAALVADWLNVGFIHGVMNTDNTSVVGETLDYGPFGFLDEYRPDTVYSSIDEGGRYAFNQQPGIAVWNLTRLAECLLPLIDADSDTAVERARGLLEGFMPRFEVHWRDGMAAKLGLRAARPTDGPLFHDLLQAMADGTADFTGTFRALADAGNGPGPADDELLARFGEGGRVGMVDWLGRWRARLAEEGVDEGERRAAMRATNPRFILRNHLAQWAVDAASDNADLEPMQRLLKVLRAPFDDHPGEEELARPPLPEQRVRRTFCGT
ncbi:MAG: YdiU family protein [Thiohalospira sp.]